MHEKLLIQSNEVAHTNLSNNCGYISVNIVPHFWWLWPGLKTIKIYWQSNCEFKEIGQAFCYVWQRCTNRDCCSIKYPSEVDLELRSRKISILYYTRFFCIIILIFLHKARQYHSHTLWKIFSTQLINWKLLACEISGECHVSSTPEMLYASVIRHNIALWITKVQKQ